MFNIINYQMNKQGNDNKTDSNAEHIQEKVYRLA